MKKLLALLFLFSTSALAQSVQQTGTVTPGHAAMWAANGVVKDAGTAANGFLTSLGVQNNGGPGICVNSGPITGPYNQLCLAASTASNAILSLQNYNGATAQSLGLIINGVPVSLGSVPGGTSGQIQYNNAGSLGGYNKSGNGVIIASTTGALTSGDCVKIDASGNFVDNGGACGSAPAGSNGQVQFNNSGAFGSSANLTWSSPTLTLGSAGATAGALAFANATSGSVTFQPAAGALGSSVLTIPAITDTLAGKALANGGTNANLTASNGGIAYSSASALAVLAGTATANLPLLSGSSTAPGWASISYPTSATSGGIPYFSSTGAISSSALLTANALMLGGGVATAPTVLGSLGTTATVLHGNAAGVPSFGSVSLTADVSGTLPLTNGGTNANLTASNGGIVYSGASALAILGGTVTAGQCLLSGSNTAPTWGSCSAVSSVSASGTSLTISPTTGAVLAGLNLAHSNNWNVDQYFAGQVGIGNTSPNHKLDVSGNIGIAASGYFNYGATDGTTGYGIRDNAGTLEWKNSGGTWAAIGTGGGGSGTVNAGGAGQLAWYSGAGTVVGGSSVIGIFGGNVGIGQTNPGYKLDVVGDAQISATLRLAATTTSTTGVILKGGNRFIHDYKAPSTNGNNVFVGFNSGNFTMAWDGVNAYTASTNIGLGALTLSSLTTGYSNMAIGYGSLTAATTAQGNVGIGTYSLLSNTTGVGNIGIGGSAISDLNITNNTDGYNTAIGFNTGRGITTGKNNTIIGANIAGLAAALTGNIILSDGAGTVKLQYDGSATWTATGNMNVDVAHSHNKAGVTITPHINVKTDYGAVGDGSADDTTAINNAIAAANAAANTPNIYLPAGTYKITSALTTITAPVVIRGDGIAATTINAVNPSYDIITFKKATANRILGGAVRDLSIVGTGSQTSGYAITTDYFGSTALTNLVISNVYNGIYSREMNNLIMRDINMDGVYGAYGIKFYGDGTTRNGEADRTDVVSLDHVVINGGNSHGATAAILIDGFIQTFQANSLILLGAQKGLYVTNTPATTPPAFLILKDFESEDMTAECIRVSTAATDINITNIYAVGTAGVQLSSAVVYFEQSAARINIANGKIAGGYNHGLVLDTVTSVNMANVHLYANSRQTANTYSGIYVGNGAVNKLTITGGTSSAAAQKYGIDVFNVAGTRVAIFGMDTTGNATAGVHDAGSKLLAGSVYW